MVLKQFKCERCQSVYLDEERLHYPGKPCKECNDAKAIGRKIFLKLNVMVSVEDRKEMEKLLEKLNPNIKSSREEDKKTLEALERLLKKHDNKIKL